MELGEKCIDGTMWPRHEERRSCIVITSMFSGATSSTFVAVTAMLLFALDERIAVYPRDVRRPYVGTWHARGIAIRQKRRGGRFYESRAVEQRVRSVIQACCREARSVSPGRPAYASSVMTAPNPLAARPSVRKRLLVVPRGSVHSRKIEVARPRGAGLKRIVMRVSARSPAASRASAH